MSTRTITTPGGDSYPLFRDMLRQPHLLVAGATGSGKSVVVNGIIHEILVNDFPNETQLVLIDPKRVELNLYRNCPHTILYASEPSDMVEALRKVLKLIDERYTQMAAQGLRKWPGGHVYVIIDEYADLVLLQKQVVQPLVQRIAQIARAASVHLILCTQCPLASVITTPIRCNLDSRVGLRTRSAGDSRNILGTTGCELLPRYGQAYYMTPDGTEKVVIPYVKDDELERVAKHWLSQY